MSPVQGAETARIGEILIEANCCQGACFDAPARVTWLSRDENVPEWCIKDENIEDASLIIVSQDCDICAPPKTEPRVEAIALRWTKNSTEIHTAHKGNSARLFCLRRESKERALIADARCRVQLDKTALVGLKFESAFEDDRSRTRFARWVAGRYERPAIPNEFVNAIQKPIVKAVGKLIKQNDELLDTLDRVAELRFSIVEDALPWTVRFVVMIDDEDEINVEEDAVLRAWLDEILANETSPIKQTSVEFRTDSTISFRDYYETIRLQLDHFSPEEDG